MKHTPGPWFFDVHPDKSQAIFWDTKGYNVFLLSHTFPHDVSANARLVAAAPDMLNLLMQIANGSVMSGNFTHAETVETYQRLARAAIAKATGGEE